MEPKQLPTGEWAYPIGAMPMPARVERITIDGIGMVYSFRVHGVSVRIRTEAGIAPLTEDATDDLIRDILSHFSGVEHVWDGTIAREMRAEDRR